MRRTVVFFVASLLLLSGTAIGAKTKYRVFTPSGAGKSQFLKSGEKKHKYFLLEEGKSLSFDIKGPIKAKIRTRAELPKGVSFGEYEIQIWEGDKLIAGRKVKSSVSKLKPEKGNASVGLAREVFFKVPRGTHKYIIRLVSGKIEKFYLRFYQEKKKKKRSVYVTYNPVKHERTVGLKSKKSTIPYYLVDGDGGTELKIIGPTKIKIYCRANFDPTMKEKSKFALGVFEKGKSVEKFSGIAKKSTRSGWVDLAELIPSTLHKFTLDVPPGEHIYEFKKMNSSAPSLSVRFKMLKSSLGNRK